MTTSISTKNFEQDKHSWFNLKKFKIGSVDFSEPEKSIDSIRVMKNEHDKITTDHQFKFCESRKIVKDFPVVKSIYEEGDDKKIDSFFHKYDYAGKLPHAINLTFNFCPPSTSKDHDALEGFYDHYHSQSNFLLTVPNLKIYKHKEATGKTKAETERIVSNAQYLQFVDKSVEDLDMKNHKPIFVPISLRFSIKDVKEVMAHYLKKEYYNIWFDFEGAAINDHSIPVIRAVHRALLKKKVFDKAVTYFTNVRREIILNFKDPASPASDVLCSVAGANLVGVNRNISRYFKRTNDQQQKDGHIPLTSFPTEIPPVNYNSRLLEAQSYYYMKNDNKEYESESKYTAYNSLVLAIELRNQSSYFKEHGGSVLEFLNKKKMLNDYRGGAILRKLTFAKSPESEEEPSMFED
ncbi:MAG: hypothetical protein ACYC7D_05225 [Nitrososphaerales archaeon]